jgi:hypothetical protein
MLFENSVQEKSGAVTIGTMALVGVSCEAAVRLTRSGRKDGERALRSIAL